MIHSEFKEIAQKKHENKIKTPHQRTTKLKAFPRRFDDPPTSDDRALKPTSQSQSQRRRPQSQRRRRCQPPFARPNELKLAIPRNQPPTIILIGNAFPNDSTQNARDTGSTAMPHAKTANITARLYTRSPTLIAAVRVLLAAAEHKHQRGSATPNRHSLVSRRNAYLRANQLKTDDTKFCVPFIWQNGCSTNETCFRVSTKNRSFTRTILRTTGVIARITWPSYSEQPARSLHFIVMIALSQTNLTSEPRDAPDQPIQSPTGGGRPRWEARARLSGS